MIKMIGASLTNDLATSETCHVRFGTVGIIAPLPQLKDPQERLRIYGEVLAAWSIQVSATQQPVLKTRLAACIEEVEALQRVVQLAADEDSIPDLAQRRELQHKIATLRYTAPVQRVLSDNYSTEPTAMDISEVAALACLRAAVLVSEIASAMLCAGITSQPSRKALWDQIADAVL